MPTIKDLVYEGDYNVSNEKLDSLSGCPQKINGGFACSYNNLTSLEGSPKIVTGNYDCSNNKLTTLKYCPEEIKGYFSCPNNNLKSLEYCPKFIKESFDCSGNPELKNVKEQIIKYQIKAKKYFTDDVFMFDFEDIKEEFEKYGNYLLKKEQNRLKQKTKENIQVIKQKINNKDYGLSI